MSRCFPFPPPGYESKARPNDLNLIVKEDKHKKHKKDKDKKERSKRKDKERAEGKHKEDKDRKQKKHKDKKDKKDKKEKRKSSEENKVVRPSSENQNGEKLGNGWHDNGNPVEFGNGDGAMDEKRSFLEEKKIINHSENQNRGELGPGNKSGDGAHGLVGMGKEISTNEKKIVGLHSDNLIGERPGSYNDDTCDGGRNNMKEKHKPFDKNIAGPSEIQNSENARVYNKAGYGANENRALFEMAGRVRADDGTTYNSYPIVSGHNLRVDAQCSGNTWVGNFSGEKQIMVESSPCQANSVEKKKDGKEKAKLENSVGEGDGRKNRDKKKEDKKRKREDEVKIEERKIKQRASDGNLLDMCANKPVDLLKEGWDKQPELKEQFTLNGFVHGENETQPDNTLRAAISSRQVDQKRNGVPGHKNTIIPLAADKQQALITKHMVNGSKLPSPQSVIKNVWDPELCPTANNSSPEPPRACVKNHDVGNGSRVQNGKRKDKKELGVNGVLKGKKVIPPHPDLKYLCEILTVPKIEPPPFSDNDEEWLFGCNKDAKKAKFGSSVVGCTERVWADAIRLEAADVVAMPYVNIF